METVPSYLGKEMLLERESKAVMSMCQPHRRGLSCRGLGINHDSVSNVVKAN